MYKNLGLIWKFSLGGGGEGVYALRCVEMCVHVQQFINKLRKLVSV